MNYNISKWKQCVRTQSSKIKFYFSHRQKMQVIYFREWPDPKIIRQSTPICDLGDYYGLVGEICYDCCLYVCVHKSQYGTFLLGS